MIPENMEEMNPEAFTISGMDAACIGYIDTPQTGITLVYSYDKLVKKLMRDNKWDYETAIQFCDYNIVGACGVGFPVIMYTASSGHGKTEKKKVGRPRKEVKKKATIPVKTEKKKVGRPRKEVKRPVGRPRKEVKRPVGRPRKEVKRPVGRPRKQGK